MEKTIFHIMVEDEYARSKKMLEVYTNELKRYPKGSIQTRLRNGRKYSYLTFRSDGKVVSRYLNQEEVDLNELAEQIRLRKQCEKNIRTLHTELKEMEYALSYRGWKN